MSYLKKKPTITSRNLPKLTTSASGSCYLLLDYRNAEMLFSEQVLVVLHCLVILVTKCYPPLSTWFLCCSDLGAESWPGCRIWFWL